MESALAEANDQRPDDRERCFRIPPPMDGVKVPNGPFVETLRARSGDLAYDAAPVAILRGAWEGRRTDRDARWLFDALRHSAVKRDVKIARGSHLTHLGAMRGALWCESIAFFDGDDVAPVPM